MYLDQSKLKTFGIGRVTLSVPVKWPMKLTLFPRTEWFDFPLGEEYIQEKNESTKTFYERIFIITNNRNRSIFMINN